MCDEYNGWTNRETWAVALHINNDQGWQASVHGAIRAAIEADESMTDYTPGTYNGDHKVALQEYVVGLAIRENVEQAATVDGWAEYIGDDATDLPAAQSRIAEDIGSLYRVNWDELGAAFLSDLGEQS